MSGLAIFSAIYFAIGLCVLVAEYTMIQRRIGLDWLHVFIAPGIVLFWLMVVADWIFDPMLKRCDDQLAALLAEEEDVS